MIGLPQETAESIHQASELIKSISPVVVLTGAGISTPSGIPDFRSPGTGLWTQFMPMEVASLSAFRYNPEGFYTWFHPLAIRMFSAQPNPAHVALARLQTSGYITTIITQNIDGLLTCAGAINVLEVHGSLNTLSCVKCFRQVPSAEVISGYIENCTIPHCPVCGGILKPDIILYEEQLPVRTWHKAEEACRNCSLMLIAGTSLEVMPSAKLPIMALDNHARLIMVNNAETYIDVRADVTIRADVAEILPMIAGEVMHA